MNLLSQDNHLKIICSFWNHNIELFIELIYNTDQPKERR